MAYHGMEKVSDYILTHKAVLVLVCVVVFTLTVLCASQVMAGQISPYSSGAIMYSPDGDPMFKLEPGTIVVATSITVYADDGQYTLVRIFYYGEMFSGYVKSKLVFK